MAACSSRSVSTSARLRRHARYRSSPTLLEPATTARGIRRPAESQASRRGWVGPVRPGNQEVDMPVTPKPNQKPVEDEVPLDQTPSFTRGRLIGDDLRVPVLDGEPRQYTDLDGAATTSPSVEVVRAVLDFLPWYSSVHRGAGAKSQCTSARYEEARKIVTRFVGADPATHTTLFSGNTTGALNLLAFRLGLTPADAVVTTAVEHHANLLPWRRYAQLRVVDVDEHGTFDVEAVIAALDRRPTPRVLAVTGASNVTGWLSDLAPIAAAARDRDVLVVVDGAQL